MQSDDQQLLLSPQIFCKTVMKICHGGKFGFQSVMGFLQICHSGKFGFSSVMNFFGYYRMAV